MGEGRSEIIAGIRDLRAKAAAQLTGNAYYMIVQQLDSLERSADLNDEAAYSIYKTISQVLPSQLELALPSASTLMAISLRAATQS
jgi:hypothetical protein